MNPDYSRTKTCSFCGEQIAFDERRCPFCCSLLNENKLETPAFYGNEFNQPYQNEFPQTDTYNSNQYNQMPPYEYQQAFEQPGPIQNQPYGGPDIINWTNDGQIPAQQFTQNIYQQTDASNRKAEENNFSTRFKVFLTAACSVVPGLGQLAGIIISIILMSSEESEDKRKFGAALMLSSVVTFAFQCIMVFLLVIGLSPYTL